MLSFKINVKNQQPLDLLKILSDLFVEIFSSDENIAIINRSGFGLMSVNNPEISNIHAYGLNSYRLLSINNMSVEGLAFVNLKNMYVIRFLDLQDNLKFASETSCYYRFCRCYLSKVLSALKVFFGSLYQHLSKRTFNKVRITDIERVRFIFAEVINDFELLEVSFNSDSAVTFPFIAERLAMILSKLVHLGGARSVLNHGLMQFMYEFHMINKVVGLYYYES